MNLPKQIKGIEVYYDGRCGMCCSFHEWINRQPRAFKIEFIPYQSPHAEQKFPGLGTLDPAREMVVRTHENGNFPRSGSMGLVSLQLRKPSGQLRANWVDRHCFRGNSRLPDSSGEPPCSEQGFLSPQG